MSLICIEGVAGVGKTTLLDSLKDTVPCIPFFEDVESNPFLHDFSQNPTQYAIHVQYTFLLLQERRFRAAAVQARGNFGIQRRKNVQKKLAQEPPVICDFHPLKSRIFSSVILTAENRAVVRQLYRLLYIPEPDLIVYLRADAQTILARLKKRNTPFQPEGDLTSIMQMCQAYDKFFRTYKGDVITLDTTSIDSMSGPLALSVILQAVPLLSSHVPINDAQQAKNTDVGMQAHQSQEKEE